MGFQEILRALPMTDAARNLELETGKHAQISDYAELFKRNFTAIAAGSGTAATIIAPITQSARPGRAHRSISHAILARADPLSATYPHERRDDLAEYVRQKMLAFVNNPTHVAALGRRKCYEAGYFFERPRPYLDNATPQHWAALSEILASLLGISVIARPEESAEASNSKATAELVIYGGRHKWIEAR